MMQRLSRLLLLSLLIAALALPWAIAQEAERSAGKGKGKGRENPQVRAASLHKLAEHLGIGPGSVIADIGAGSGRDTWTFADIVGEKGKVLAEEIEEDKTQSLDEEAKKRGLSQVQAVLGQPTDPSLPAGTIDMAYMNQVYHHFSKPREMLQGIWKGLKPGGCLVIVDQRLGTLVDWVPHEERAGKHYWIAETTVVREAREQGFLFVECAEPYWHMKEAFVLVFRRPATLDKPDRDPDAPSVLPVSVARQLLPPAGRKDQHVAFVALGEGRKLIGPILDATSATAVDIVLEEWATQKDERPPLPPGVTLPSVLTEQGDPHLGPEPLDAVYFLDSYHLLFHGPTLLAQLRERLIPSGRIYILDRQAPRAIPHREASHRRMIAAETVKEEMSQAGFSLSKEGSRPTEDRFLLLFTRSENGEPKPGAKVEE